MKILFLVITLFLISCNSSKNDFSFPVNSEWSLDSIIGSKEWSNESICIDEKNQFWRFSFENKDYLLDSAGQISKKGIIINQELKYQIQFIDSTKFILKQNSESKIIYKREPYFEEAYLRDYLDSRLLNIKINGTWKLIESNIPPKLISIPSSCNQIIIGSKFHFFNGSMKISKKDSIQACNIYGYSISENKINFSDYDLLLEFDIESVSNKKLVLRSFNPPTYEKGDTVFISTEVKIMEEGYLMIFERIKPSETEISDSLKFKIYKEIIEDCQWSAPRYVVAKVKDSRTGKVKEICTFGCMILAILNNDEKPVKFKEIILEQALNKNRLIELSSQEDLEKIGFYKYSLTELEEYAWKINIDSLTQEVLDENLFFIDFPSANSKEQFMFSHLMFNRGIIVNRGDYKSTHGIKSYE